MHALRSILTGPGKPPGGERSSSQAPANTNWAAWCAAVCTFSADHQGPLIAQVKPFILRRTKDTVLVDLPPKILQDVYVDASPLQRSLYQDFAASGASQEVQGALQAGVSADADKAPHVFQVCRQVMTAGARVAE